MKNLLIGILLLVSSNYSQAQQDTIHEENIRVLADMVFAGLDSSIYGPNLLNRSFSTSTIIASQMRGDYSQVQSVVEYLEMYQALAFSYLDSNKMMSNDSIAKFLENEFLINEQYGEDDELVLPFGFLLHSMSYIDTTKADSLHFFFSNNSLVPLVAENTLYKNALIKSVAVIEFYPDNGYETAFLKYTPGLVSHSPDISNLNIMIDLGRGFEPFNETNNMLSFARLGDSIVSKVSFSYEKADSIYNDTLDFYLVTDSNNDLYKSNSDKWDWDEEWENGTHPFYDYEIGVLRGCGNTGKKIRRPIIIVPPYRPWFVNPSLNKYYKQFNYPDETFASLSDLGYDVIFIKMKPGNVSLEFAGEYLADFIEWVNWKKADDYPGEDWENIIIGYSMGGQISRYALKFMEKNHMVFNGKHHHSRLYIPFDSPHLGANTPMFTQAVYRDMRLTNIIATVAYNALRDDASKDMSVTHIVSSNLNNTTGNIWTLQPAPTSERLNFIDALTNSLNHQFTPVNDLRRSYPSFTRNVAISTARNDANYNTEYGLYPGRLLFEQSNLLGANGLGLVQKTRRIYASNYGYQSPIFRNLEICFLFGLGMIKLRDREYRTNYAAEWDLAQGGYKDDLYTGVGSGPVSILKSGTFYPGGTLEYDNHMSFLPLVSALGINPNIWSPNNLFYNVKDQGLMYKTQYDLSQTIQSDTYGYPNLSNPTNHFNVTPFEAVYCDPQTYEHIKLEESMDDHDNYSVDFMYEIRKFILNEVEAPIVYLQNKVIGKNHRQNEPDYRYRAWYKATDKIIIGNDVTPKTDLGPFVIESTGQIRMYACNEIVIGPGFESQQGSKFHAYIACDGCSTPRSQEINDSIDLNENEPTGGDRGDVVDTGGRIQKSEDVIVYPNPNNGEITIELNDILNKASYELFDLLGNKLKSGNLDATKSHLNLTIHKGFFVLKISNNGKQFIKKIQVL